MSRAVTVDALLAAVPTVTAHVESCVRCRDRRRAMVSLQDLVAGIPLETAPDRVRVVRQDNGRRGRAVSLPPPIVPDLARRPRRRLVVASTAVGLLAVIAGGTALAQRGGNSQVNRLRALTKLPPTNALTRRPDDGGGPGGRLRADDLSGRTVYWRAASPVRWLSLDPGSAPSDPTAGPG